MAKLKDSAILTLNDFVRIRENSKPLPVYSTTVCHTDFPKSRDFDETSYQKALYHKNKIIEYDKQKRAYEQLHTYEGNKSNDPYSKVSRHDDALQAMDRMCLYAKVSTVRDKQRQERKIMEEMYKKKEAKLDLMQEMERLKEMKRIEDRENELFKVRQQGNKVILDQIEQNKLERLKQKEIEEKERIELLKKIEKENEEEKRLNMLKAIENEKKLKESLEANRQAILAKQKRIQEEKEEDLKIEKYNIEKAIKEEQLFQEKKRLEHEKELELQKMREKQEKAQDKQAELDAIRARRAVEAQDAKERKKEREELIIKQKKIQDLLEANAKQKLDKEAQLVEEAIKEKEEFDRIIKEYQKEMQASKERERIKLKKMLDHNADIRIQIAQKEERERLNKREILEEGRKNKQKNDIYSESIEAIRKDKIRQLREMNINEKYIVPLERFSIKDLYSAS
jgi:hypothetical protein